MKINEKEARVCPFYKIIMGAIFWSAIYDRPAVDIGKRIFKKVVVAKNRNFFEFGLCTFEFAAKFQ